ncbi:cytokine receptor common subunit gamma [Lissotriton helveticus]
MAPCAAGTAGRTVGTRTHLARLLSSWQEGSAWLCLLLVLASLQLGLTGAAQTPTGVECIIFNTEHMTCMWNSQGRPEVNNSLFYWYNGNEDSVVECQRYLQERGINTGCWFGAAELIYFRGFNIRVNGSHGGEEVVIPTKELRLQNLVKLGPPVNLTIVNVTSNQLLLRWNSSYKRGCVEFKVRYRSNKETEYTELEVKNQFEFTYPSADPEKFYTFYVSAKVYWLCASTNLWSDWSAPIHWGKKPTEEPDGFLTTQNISIICFSIVLVIICALALLRIERIWVIILPRVPNPGKNFEELFITHNGNFSEWTGVPKDALESLKPTFNESICYVSELPLHQGSGQPNVPAQKTSSTFPRATSSPKNVFFPTPTSMGNLYTDGLHQQGVSKNGYITLQHSLPPVHAGAPTRKPEQGSMPPRPQEV